MAYQTATPAPRRPLPRTSTQRRALRLDPPNTFIAGGHTFAREPERPGWIAPENAALAAAPAAPLAAPSLKPPLSRKWLTAIAASLALHVAMAAFFLLHGPEEGVQIAGGEEAGVLLLGNASHDDRSAGEMALDDATQVTIVPIQNARPVETVDAEAVQPVETAETAEPADQVAEAVTTERLEPVQEQPVAEVVPEEPTPIAPTDTLPEILATDTPELVEDDNVVAPVQTARQQPTEVVEEAVPVTPQETVEALPEEPTEPETAIAEVLEEMARPIERPRPAPAEPKRAETKTPPVERRAEKPAPKAEQPAKRAERRAGSGGQGRADARRGREDGEARGAKTTQTGKGRASAAGNAAVTNYPGKVRSKISRAVRRISRRDRSGAERDVHVSFTVTASGGLGGLSVARSSGSSALDSAAIAAVRRAAPFPPIPDGAGRRSWQFTIPLGLAR